MKNSNKRRTFSFLSFFAGTSGVPEDLSTKVSASANYIGSIFSNAWTKTAKTANDATTSSSTFLTSAFNKVGGGSGATPATSAGKGCKDKIIKRKMRSFHQGRE